MADAIRQDRVTVNGQVVEDFRYLVNVGKDRISVDGASVHFGSQPLVYLIFNKPKGYLSTVSDERGGQTVMDLLPEKYRHLRLYPVGRLDKDSTGLLLLTNDGDLTYRLTHPRFECEKEYLVSIEGRLQPGEKRQLEQGIALEEGKTHPAIIKEVSNFPPFNYSVTIHEGRKRQVRRMLASLGYRVHALNRIRIGRLGLGELKEGGIREISAREIRTLFGK